MRPKKHGRYYIISVTTLEVIMTRDRKEYQRQWAKKNPDKCKAKAKKYRDTHREELKERAAARYAADPEKYKAKSKKFRDENPEKHREAVKKAYYKNHEAYKERSRQAYASLSPEKKKEYQTANKAVHYWKKRELIDDIKLHYGCVNPECKWSGAFHPSCLDLHHLGEKSFSIASQIASRKTSVLCKEINKCAVLCSVCHRLLHAGEVDTKTLVRCNVDENGTPKD